jgi:hypothetical protein
MTPRLKVAIVLAVLFGGVILVALFAPHARAAGLDEQAVRQSNGFALLALAAIAVFSLMRMAYRFVRCLLRLGDWAWQNRPASKAERADADALQAALDDEAALIEATNECPRNGPCAWCAPRPVTGWVPTPQWVAAQDLNQIEASWALPVAEPRRRTA